MSNFYTRYPCDSWHADTDSTYDAYVNCCLNRFFLRLEQLDQLVNQCAIPRPG